MTPRCPTCGQSLALTGEARRRADLVRARRYADETCARYRVTLAWVQARGRELERTAVQRDIAQRCRFEAEPISFGSIGLVLRRDKGSVQNLLRPKSRGA